MIRNLLTISAVTVGLLLAGLPAIAHHSISAEFDPDKPIEFAGTVKVIEWTNPHIYTQVPPNSLFRAGWRKDSLKPGDVVSVKGVRAKNEASMNIGTATIMKDGKKIFSGNSE